MDSNLATAVLIIEPRSATDEAAFSLLSPQRLPSKDSRNDILNVSSRDDTPEVFFQPPKFTLHLTDKPYDPTKGWIFGHDEDRCDFRLAINKETGVSSQHFSLWFNHASEILVLQNLSRHFTKMSSPTAGTDRFVRGSHMIANNEDTTVSAGLVSLILRTPNRGKYEDAFKKNLKAFLEEAKAAEPRPINLRLRNPSDETPLTIEAKRHRIQYVIQDRVGTGDFGRVSKAFNSETGDVVAVKEFRGMVGYNESKKCNESKECNKCKKCKWLKAIRSELQLHQSLSHVSSL
jgi:hypothetical protein